MNSILVYENGIQVKTCTSQVKTLGLVIHREVKIEEALKYIYDDEREDKDIIDYFEKVLGRKLPDNDTVRIVLVFIDGVFFSDVKNRSTILQCEFHSGVIIEKNKKMSLREKKN